MRCSVLVVCVLALLAPPPSASQEDWSPPSEAVHDLTSSANGSVYRIWVETPPGLDPGSCAEVPTFYVTDGNHDYEMVKVVTDNQLPPMVLVGIGYPDEEGLVRAMRRSVDLTPTFDEKQAANTLETYGVEVEYGGGEAFLEFIRADVIPFMEANYCASRIRALGGHSFGGLFAAYALFSDPALFDRYLMGSPSFWYDDRVIFDLEDAYSQSHVDLDAQVFLSIGEREGGDHIGNMYSLSQALLSRKYPSLEISTRLWANEDHITAKVPTFHQGIRVIFSDLVPGDR